MRALVHQCCWLIATLALGGAVARAQPPLGVHDPAVAVAVAKADWEQPLVVALPLDGREVILEAGKAYRLQISAPRSGECQVEATALLRTSAVASLTLRERVQRAPQLTAFKLPARATAELVFAPSEAGNFRIRCLGAGVALGHVTVTSHTTPSRNRGGDWFLAPGVRID